MSEALARILTGRNAPRSLVDTYLAIRRGATAFERGWHSGDGLAGRLSAEQLRCRVIGNALRELDRFLNLLIDETQMARGRPSAPAIRNTANKLTRFRQDEANATRDHERLLALGRSRACLLFTSGHVARGDRSGTNLLTIGWWQEPDHLGERALRQVATGDRLRLSHGEVAEVGTYYARIADSLIGHIGMDDCRHIGEVA